MGWDEFKAWVVSILGSLFLATFLAVAVGRIAFISEEVRAGRRRFSMRATLYELPVVFFLWLASYGLAEWLDLKMGAALGLSTFLGWIGPKVLERIVLRYASGVTPRGTP